VKTLMFVTGVSVGAVAAVGTSVGVALFALNKFSNGELAKMVFHAIGDVKDIMLDKGEN
jgi:hypothetical protein